MARPAINVCVCLGLCSLVAACSSNPPLASSSQTRRTHANTPSGDDEADEPSIAETGGSDAPASPLDEVADLPGTAFVVEVPASGRCYVDLSEARVVDPEVPQESNAWDLALEGARIFTNSGPSGPGRAAAFGPTDELDYVGDEAPEVPFLREDTPGGAFVNWYAYDGSTHSLWSRFHSYAVDDGEALWKLQVLSYYGEARGAPVSALYSLRYARVDENANGEIVELDGIDATAGAPDITDNSPSGCVDLSERSTRLLLPAELAEDERWDLCFRRDVITSNGGAGGPGAVTAVDLHADATSEETLEQIQARDATSTFDDFDALDFEALRAPDLVYRADGPTSIFDGAWLEPEDDSAPVAGTWLVRGADGESRFLVVFRAVELHDDGRRSLHMLARTLEHD